MSEAKILIIDDEIEICHNLKEMFAFEDYMAEYATTAKEALQKISENRFNLLLVDIKLEGPVSGIDIIKSFREQEKRPKIIVISAIPRVGLDPVFTEEAVMTLIDGYLDKPSCCNPDLLISLAKKVLA